MIMRNRTIEGVKNVFDTSFPNTSILASISRHEIIFAYIDLLTELTNRYGINEHLMSRLNQRISCCWYLGHQCIGNLISNREIDARIDVLGNDVSKIRFLFVQWFDFS